MTTITKTRDRVVKAGRDAAGFVIEESTAYTPTGHTKRRWTSDRVYLSLNELRIIMQGAGGDPCAD